MKKLKSDNVDCAPPRARAISVSFGDENRWELFLNRPGRTLVGRGDATRIIVVSHTAKGAEATPRGFNIAQRFVESIRTFIGCNHSRSMA